jgi:hypothetical protein
MLTLMILPKFKGKKNQFVIATIMTMLLDSIYIIPMINHIIK